MTDGSVKRVQATARDTVEAVCEKVWTHIFCFRLFFSIFFFVVFFFCLQAGCGFSRAIFKFSVFWALFFFFHCVQDACSSKGVIFSSFWPPQTRFYREKATPGLFALGFVHRCLASTMSSKEFCRELCIVFAERREKEVEERGGGGVLQVRICLNICFFCILDELHTILIFANVLV